jgi:hypothetical protein
VGFRDHLLFIIECSQRGFFVQLVLETLIFFVQRFLVVEVICVFLEKTSNELF